MSFALCSDATASSIFARTELLPKDSIVGLTEVFNTDRRPDKINLSGGTYCDDQGKVPLLNAVARAERVRLESVPSRGYQPIEGSAAFNNAAQSLVFGADHPAVSDGRIVTVQTLGGTGALKVAAEYVRRLLPSSVVYVSDPTWENHNQIFIHSGFRVRTYPYYKPETRGVDFGAMAGFLSQLPANSIVVLHACCHNPTGADLEEAHWSRLIDIVRERKLVAILDMAYLGFGDGIEADAAPVRRFAGSGAAVLVATSFSKSFCLYGERVGALSVVAANRNEAMRVQSNFKRIIRTSYSNPPTHGGALVHAVLTDPGLRSAWDGELTAMRRRIQEMRVELAGRLSAKCPKRDFSFIVRQRGMFSYTGLSAVQVARLQNEYAVYALGSGRICVSALNSRNLTRASAAIATVMNDETQ